MVPRALILALPAVEVPVNVKKLRTTSSSTKIVALPAVELSKKDAIVAKIWMVELPAVELLANCKEAKSSSMNALPALERLKKFIAAGISNSLLMPALPAVDLLKKLIPPALEMDTLLPAVALLENTIVQWPRGGSQGQ